MALTTLQDRVFAATTQTPDVVPMVRPAERVEGATPEELNAGEQAEGGETSDAVLAWLEQYADEFTAALPSHIETAAFLGAVRDALPSLSRCSPGSLRQALLTCARFGLVPDGRRAVIVCEGSQARFIPMYRGYIDLMYRSGRVSSVHVEMIHAGDAWSYVPSAPSPDDFMHEPALLKSRAERGPAVMAYAFAWLASGVRSQVVLLTREDAEEIRDQYSDAYRRAEESGTKDSFWHTHFPQMMRKSALLRLAQVVPTSAELIALEKADEAGDAGQVQVLHVPPSEEDAQALADATAAHEAAEASQEPQSPTVRKKSRTRGGGRAQPKRLSRKARKEKGKTR
ncbi:recombinase RecT [Embleya sp. NPDC001921]